MPERTQESIMAEVAKAGRYVVVLLKRGPHYDTTGELQMPHLQHVFAMRDAGQQLITLPVRDLGEIVGIGLMATSDKDEVSALMERDPGVVAGRFTFELLSCMGMPGDTVR